MASLLAFYLVGACLCFLVFWRFISEGEDNTKISDVLIVVWFSACWPALLYAFVLFLATLSLVYLLGRWGGLELGTANRGGHDVPIYLVWLRIFEHG